MSKWPTVKLGDICDVVAGGTPSRSNPEYFGGDVPWVKIGDMLQGEVTKTEEYLTQQGVDNSAAKVLPAGTILISIFATIGRTAVLGIDATTNQAIVGLLLKDSAKIVPSFLRYALDHATATLVKQARGVAQVNINGAILKSLTVPLPPLDEQRRIAGILDKADALRQKRRQAIAKLDELAQATFLEMFGDPVTNPMGWPVKKLGNIGTLDRGVSKHRPRNDPALLGGKHPLVQTGEVANSSGYIREYKSTYSDLGLRQSKMWPKGTLCITIAANIAKTGILTFDACFPDSVVGFLDKEPATIEYVRIWLSFLQKTLEESAPESAQKNINLAILRDLNVPFPPVDLQKKFVMIIHQGELQRSMMQKEYIGLDKLFSSLQSDAFSGELS